LIGKRREGEGGANGVLARNAKQGRQFAQVAIEGLNSSGNKQLSRNDGCGHLALPQWL